MVCSPTALPARLSASAAAFAIAAEAAAAAKPTGRFRPRLVHGERATTHLVAVELRRRLLRFLVGRHFDERKPARAPGCRIAHHADRFDGSRLAEELLQFRLARCVGNVPDVQPATHLSTLSSRWCSG